MTAVHPSGMIGTEDKTDTLGQAVIQLVDGKCHHWARLRLHDIDGTADMHVTWYEEESSVINAEYFITEFVSRTGKTYEPAPLSPAYRSCSMVRNI